MEKRKTSTSSKVKNRYNKKAYKQFHAQIKPSLYDKIEAYTTTNGISKPEFLRRSIEALEK